MKRYLVFTYDCYYPQGGWNDFRASFETLEEARKFCADSRRDYKEIIDSETGLSVD